MSASVNTSVAGGGAGSESALGGGGWVHRGMFSNYGRGDITRAGGVGPNTVAETVQQMGRYGVTVVHQNFLSGWAANFPNAYVPHRTADTIDYLQQTIDAESGVAIHPWVECWVAAWQDAGGPSYAATLASYQASGLLLQTLVVGDGYTTPTEPVEKMLSPANPTARALMKDAIVDMVRTHSGISGIMLDYHRYPSYLHQGDFSAAGRAAFEAWSGSAVVSFPTDVKSGGSRHASWLLFATYCITSWVAELAAAVRAVRSSVLIGCTPFPTQTGREIRHQYVEQWAQAGSIDYMEPQIYTHLTAETFEDMVDDCVTAVAGTDCELYPLIYTYGDATNARDATEVYAERSTSVDTYNLGGWSEFTWVTGYPDQLQWPFSWPALSGGAGGGSSSAGGGGSDRTDHTYEADPVNGGYRLATETVDGIPHTYGYDGTGRLSTDIWSAGGLSRTITYDATSGLGEATGNIYRGSAIVTTASQMATLKTALAALALTDKSPQFFVADYDSGRGLSLEWDNENNGFRGVSGAPIRAFEDYTTESVWTSSTSESGNRFSYSVPYWMLHRRSRVEFTGLAICTGTLGTKAIRAYFTGGSNLFCNAACAASLTAIPVEGEVVFMDSMSVQRGSSNGTLQSGGVLVTGATDFTSTNIVIDVRYILVNGGDTITSTRRIVSVWN